MLLKRGWPLCALLACSGPAPVDGGADAALDAAVDAGRDGGRDAGRDAGWDAGHDAGPDDPGWEPWATVGECSFERAANPERLLQVEWEPCHEGLAPLGCRGAVGLRDFYSGAGWFDGEEGYYSLNRFESERVLTTVLASVSRGPLAAWRAPLRTPSGVCLLNLGVGGGAVAIVATYGDGDAPATQVDHVFHGPVSAVADLRAPVSIISPGVQPQRVAVSSEMVAFWTGYWAIGVDPISGRSARLNEALPGTPQNVQVVGARVFWEDWADLVRVGFGDLSSPATLFHRADPGDIKGFRTYGQDFAWFQGFDRQPDGRYARLELWTAPYTDDPAALEPRMVRPMEVRNGSAFGGGWYVVWRGDPRGYEIIDVPDGTRRWWLAPVSQDPLYVSEHEILAPGLIRFDPHELPIAD